MTHDRTAGGTSGPDVAASRFDVATDDLKGRVLRGGVTRVVVQGVLFVLRLGSVVVLARLLEPADFGLVNMVTVVTGLLGLFRDAGLSVVTVQRPSISHGHLSSLFWLNLLVGALLLALSVVAAPILAAFYGEPRLFWITVALGTGFFFNGAGVQHAALLQRQMRFSALAGVDVAAAAAGVAVGVLLAVFGYAYWALVGMELGFSLIYSASVWFVSGWIPALPRRTGGVVDMIRLGSLVSLNGLVVYIAYNTDKLLLGRFAGAEPLGLYGRAFQLVNVPTQTLHQTLSTVAISALSRLQADGARLRSYFLKGYSVFAAVTIPITVACALFATDIIQVVLGPRWHAAALLLRLLAPTIVAFALLNPVGWLLFAEGNVRRSLRMALVIAPVVVVSCSVGVYWGAVGVAVAFSLAMCVLTIGLVPWGLRGSAVSAGLVVATLRAPSLAVLAATLVSWPIAARLTGEIPSGLKLLCEGALFGAGYLGVLLYPMRQKDFYMGLLRELRNQRAETSRAPG